MLTAHRDFVGGEGFLSNILGKVAGFASNFLRGAAPKITEFAVSQAQRGANALIDRGVEAVGNRFGGQAGQIAAALGNNARGFVNERGADIGRNLIDRGIGSVGRRLDVAADRYDEARWAPAPRQANYYDEPTDGGAVPGAALRAYARAIAAKHASSGSGKPRALRYR